MVSTMPVAIAELRERLARLDSQLSGVDNNLERIAGADPNVTEEIRMTQGQRAKIDAATSGIDDTDTSIPLVSRHVAALAEVDAVLGEFGPPPELPDLPPSTGHGSGFGRRDTMPEMPVSPPMVPQADLPSSGDASARAAATSAGGGQGGGMRLVAALLVLSGAGYFIWQASQVSPAPQPNTQAALVSPTPPAASPTPPVAVSPVGAVTPPAASPTLPAPQPAVTPPAPQPAVQVEAADEAVNLAPMVVPPQPDEVPSTAGRDVPVAPVAVGAAALAKAPPVASGAVAVEGLSAPPGGGTPSASVATVAAVVRDAPAPISKERPASGIPEGELIDALEAIRADPAPREIVRGIHYFVSNENKHHLWRKQVTDLGGIMVGVGAEQNYLIAGWARPEILVLMDFDIYIPWLHKAYRVAFDLASTPDELIALWQDSEGRERLKAGIIRAYGETGEVQDILRAVKYAKAVGRHLAKLKARYVGLGIPCFLTDQGQYDFIVNLWRSGRVLAIRGDLTGQRTMVDLAAFSRISDLPIRLLYMSNAEFYFRFKAGRFRDNIVGLPFDARSLVLRTDPHSGTKYRFYEQQGENFVAWLERGRAVSVASMGKYRTRRDEPDDFVLDKLPEQVGKAR
jgi:hypothetical protein